MHDVSVTVPVPCVCCMFAMLTRINSRLDHISPAIFKTSGKTRLHTRGAPPRKKRRTDM